MTDKTYYQGTRSDVASLLPSKYTQVLEIGCGEGGFAANLKIPCQIWGIEPVTEVAEIAQQRMDKVLIGTYESVYDELPDHYFDLVICNDVIEHLPDPDQFFISIKSKLQPNAFIIGSVPNVRYVWNLYELLIKKDWKYGDSGVLDRTHLRFFTEKSLRQLFEQYHLTIEEFYGINNVLTSTESLKVKFFNFLFSLIILLSLGSHQDIKFLQFAFRVKF